MKWLGVKASKIFEGLLSKLFEILNIIFKIPSCENQAIVVQGFDNWDTLWDQARALFLLPDPHCRKLQPLPCLTEEWYWKIQNNSFLFLPGVIKGHWEE